jgi:hypothetical protein
VEAEYLVSTGVLMKTNRHFHSPFARRLRFESLEDRRVLAASMGLSDAPGISPKFQGMSPDYVNVSNQPTAY